MYILTILLQSDVSNANLFNNYLMLGYGVMWLIGMVYVASLIMRQRNIQKDIQLMQQILQEDEQSG
jgi:CcmD family protein